MKKMTTKGKALLARFLLPQPGPELPYNEVEVQLFEFEAAWGQLILVETSARQTAACPHVPDA